MHAGGWWSRNDQIPSPVPGDPPLAVGRFSSSSGSVRLGIGLVLFAVGAAMLYGTVRNPVFDPSMGLRSPVDEGTAAVDVPEAGAYVVYLESSDCRSDAFALHRVGDPSVSFTPVTSTDFARYDYESLCGQPLGTAPIPVAGLWTATPTVTDGVNVVLYPEADPPTSLDWALSWLFLPALVVGAGLVTQGAVTHVRWRQSLRDAASELDVNEGPRPPRR